MELDFGQTETKASIIDFVKQARKKTASVPKSEFIESNSPIAIIRNIIALTQERLGKHKDDYILIQDEVTLQSYIDKAVSNGVIAIDTETTGLDPILDNLVGVCIYTPTEKAAYIPINHVGYVSGARLQGQLSEDVVAEQLKRCLGIKSIFFNAKFDIRVMKNHLGLNFVPAWDGSIAAKVLNEIEEENNLKYLHKKYCGNLDEAHYTFEKMFKGLTFSLIPIDTAYLYAAHDAIITYELYKYQEGLLGDSSETCPVEEFRKLSFVYHKIELPLITVVADMEENGICLDVDFAKQLSVEYHELLDKAEAKFRKACDIYHNQIQKYKIKHKDCKLSNPINVNSPVQLAILFYDILQCKSPSKKEPRGTGSDILKVFDNDLSKAILEYREIAKLLSTYIDKLPEVINTKTNRIHASFHQYGTDCVTGDTLIVTDTGFYKIGNLLENICDKDAVMYPLDINIINKNRVQERAIYGIRYTDVPTIRIKGLYGYEIEGTPNHPIMVSSYTAEDCKRNFSDKVKRTFWNNRYFKKLEDVKIGDYIEVPCGWDYNVSEYVKLPYKMDVLKTHKSDGHIIPTMMTEDFAELLGMYHADGTIHDTNRYSIRINNCDGCVQKRVAELVKSLFGVDCHTFVEKNRKKQSSVSFSVSHCKTLLNSLLNRGALNKQIPDIIYKSPASVIAAYLRGLTLDSSRCKVDKYKISVQKKTDARFIQMFLASRGILAGVNVSRYNYKNRHQQFYTVTINCHNLNQFLNLINPIQEKKRVKQLGSHCRYKNVLLGNSFRIRVTEIEHCRNTVWDLHVPITHSFLSNSMISHNTGRFSSSDPNLQNIPSHNKKIRKMFTASTTEIIKSQDNLFIFLLHDIIPTANGDKNVSELKAGDVILCDDGKVSITKIEKDDKHYKIYFEEVI